MKGILIIAHGSRQKETLTTMDTIYDMVRVEFPHILIERAYMEFNEVNLEKGLDILVEKGATDIAVVPYFLFSGIHIRKDIPDEIAEYQKTHPNIKITMGQTLGADKRIAEVLADRVRQVL